MSAHGPAFQVEVAAERDYLCQNNFQYREKLVNHFAIKEATRWRSILQLHQKEDSPSRKSSFFPSRLSDYIDHRIEVVEADIVHQRAAIAAKEEQSKRTVKPIPAFGGKSLCGGPWGASTCKKKQGVWMRETRAWGRPLLVEEEIRANKKMDNDRYSISHKEALVGKELMKELEGGGW